MDDNFLKLTKDIKLQLPETPVILRWINKKKTTYRYITLKLMTTKDEKNIKIIHRKKGAPNIQEII